MHILAPQARDARDAHAVPATRVLAPQARDDHDVRAPPGRGALFRAEPAAPIEIIRGSHIRSFGKPSVCASGSAGAALPRWPYGRSLAPAASLRPHSLGAVMLATLAYATPVSYNP